MTGTLIVKGLKCFLGRTFTLRKLFEHSIHKFNQNSAFISSIQNYSSKIYFHPFPKNNQIVILIKKEEIEKLCATFQMDFDAKHSSTEKYLTC